MITPGACMASVNLKMLITASQSTKTLLNTSNCFWEDHYFAFQCSRNGYGPALRMFTKVLKQPFGFLRSQGHQSVVYADDSYL